MLHRDREIARMVQFIGGALMIGGLIWTALSALGAARQREATELETERAGV